MVSPTSAHRDAPATRAAVQGLIRGELDGLGDRLAAFREAASAELERLAALRWLTDFAGIGPTEVAERAGVSRQTLANLRSDARAVDYKWPVDLRVLLELGIHGPKTGEQLERTIGKPPLSDFQVSRAISRLTADELIAVARREAARAGEPDTFWRLTAKGLEDLPRRLRHAAMPPSRRWTAYVTSSPAEAAAIAAAGERALGEHGVAVVPAGTVHGMEAPEVAFVVEAPDPQRAQTEAIAVFRRLRERAGMTPRQSPVVVSALAPPPRRDEGPSRG
jgi:transcriptional regulator with XRE-family HTH domain